MGPTELAFALDQASWVGARVGAHVSIGSHGRRRWFYARMAMRDERETPAETGWERDGLRGATSHPTYREWASEALGDERQVYARSTVSPSRSLVFLPHGAAEDFREAARRGELACPVPGCPSPLLTTRGPATRRHHFVHRHAPVDQDHQRSYVRRVANDLLRSWIAAAHPRSSLEADATVDDVDVAVLVTGPGGARFAVVFVDHRLGADAWRAADERLEAASIARGWIFAPRQYLRYPESSPDAPEDDPAVLDRRRGDIVLDRPVFREMRHDGRWPLLLSIERRELANLIPPTGSVAARLKLTPPASGDRVLHLLTTPLEKCGIGLDGIETPAVGANVLAAPRLARERALSRANVPTAPRLARERALSEMSRSQELARSQARQDSDVSRKPKSKAERRAPATYRVRETIDACGPVTTLATLMSQLGMHDEERQLREQLNTLRAEAVIEFDRPLGLFCGIRVRKPALTQCEHVETTSASSEQGSHRERRLHPWEG
jgi:hypothetical protein